MTLLEKAKYLIHIYFADKVDKGGHSYIGHLSRVAAGVLDENRKMSLDSTSPLSIFYDKCYIVALLHDIVEDTEVTFDMLREEGFDEDIIEAIEAITRKKTEDKYSEFIIRVNENDIARLVKTYDLKDNMDITRLKEFGEYEQKRLRKYFYSYKYLTKEITKEEYLKYMNS